MFEDIKEQFKAIINSSQHYEDLTLSGVDDYFDDYWLKNKARFIKAFGGLIYEYPQPVSFVIEQDLQAKNINDFIDNIPYSELRNFIQMNKEGFYENKVVNPYITQKGQLIPEGAKLVKAFKNFTDDVESLASIQNTASHIIQQKEVSGTLCLSVHPLDFLTLSVNKCGWTSCVNLFDGEYKASILSFMGDPCTIVCYIKTSEGDKVPYPGGFEWNSKKWRMLLSISEDKNMIVANRQYPFTSKACLDFIYNIIKELFDLRGYYTDMENTCIDKIESSIGKDYLLSNKYLLVNGNLYRSNLFITEPAYYMRLHYNDVTMSPFYKPYYSYNKTKIANEKTKVLMGSKCYCLQCSNDNMEFTDSLICDECEYEFTDIQRLRCDNCYKRIEHDGETMGTWVKDGWLCDDCFDRLASVCEVCGEFMYNDFAYTDEIGNTYCKYCYEHLGEE